MSAPAHSPARAARRTSTGKRLPWWSVVLPALSFAVLLVLVAGPGQAHASPATQDGPGIAYLVGRLLDVLPL
ncbi:hypothetical protein ACIO3O_38900 [Streptomyces sp. NPDC087440]|uniref:hypothetical protein n=1 Tax=Streptomyces sp. NPDC087440 TaxID=3365790 RepID=UPI0037F34FFD